MIIDFSAVDRAVERVIAKHEILFAMERIAREKVGDDLHPLFAMDNVARKTVRLCQLAAKYKRLIDSGVNANCAAKPEDALIVGQPGNRIAEDAIKKLIAGNASVQLY